MDSVYAQWKGMLHLPLTDRADDSRGMPRPRPFWPCTVATVIVVPLLYVASFGLACRLAAEPGSGGRPVRKWMYVYQPIVWTMRRCPGGDYALLRFAVFFMPSGTELPLPGGYEIKKG